MSRNGSRPSFGDDDDELPTDRRELPLATRVRLLEDDSRHNAELLGRVLASQTESKVRLDRIERRVRRPKLTEWITLVAAVGGVITGAIYAAKGMAPPAPVQQEVKR